ncbi:hypothetical protein ACIQZO_07765 [Streptomyces sp. NPDC097617]|uniref:hypothetical protein n=1 Tax=Streptomyces sp. NPDC097617 TaxID=3366091 RepID=UPI003822196D
MSQNVTPPAPDSFTAAPAPAPARTGNLGLGVVAAVVAALVAAGAYGGIMNAIDREIGYAAIGVGLLVGLAAGKIGGRNPILPAVAALLSLGAVYLGQLFFIALVLADYGKVGVGEVFSEVGFGGLADLWKEGMDFMSYVFLAIGGAAAFSAAKKMGD